MIRIFPLQFHDSVMKRTDIHFGVLFARGGEENEVLF